MLYNIDLEHPRTILKPRFLRIIHLRHHSVLSKHVSYQFQVCSHIPGFSTVCFNEMTCHFLCTPEHLLTYITFAPPFQMESLFPVFVVSRHRPFAEEETDPMEYVQKLASPGGGLFVGVSMGHFVGWTGRASGRTFGVQRAQGGGWTTGLFGRRPRAEDICGEDH